jgi:glycosyltransferase involved in cell wall biosynthesis
MRILLVTTIFPPEIGGPSRLVWDLAQVLTKKTSLEPIIFTFGERTERKEEQGVLIYRIALRKELRGLLGTLMRQADAFQQLIRIMRREKIDLIHCHEVVVLGLVTGIVARLLRKPSIIKYPGDLVYENLNRNALKVRKIENAFNFSLLTRLMTTLERLIFKLHTKVWAVSKFQQNILLTHLLVPRKKILFMPNYISTHGYKQKYGKPSSPARVLIMSRFTPWKQIEKLEEVIKSLGNEPIVFSVLGGGDERIRRRIEWLATKSPFATKIKFFGQILPQKAYKEFNRADIFLSLSCYEPFAVSLIEAAMSGLPTIAPKVGGIPEMVKDGATGFLYEEGNWLGAADKIKKLVKNQNLYRRLSQNAHKMAENYDINSRTSEMIRFYKAVSPV